nr:melanoma antigen preferentially expressed in tumors-like [Odocoileus virginianus texanus]
MSVRNTLRLLNLAGKSLLTDEALAISALEYLPIELFPPLFMEAFCGRHRKTLKALVQAWPFVRLPLGALMQTPHLGTLQAVLDGLDVLLTQKAYPRKCKLRVLDLRNTGQDFWRMWSGSSVHVSSSSSMAPMAEDGSRIKKPLVPFEVFTELHLKERTMSEFLTYLLKWMSNVQKLFVSHIHLPDPEEWNEQHIVKITSQFLRLHHLHDLHLESPLYLEGCLDQMLRCLVNPLDNLSITHCLLTDSDLTHLSQSPNISQLKSLNLSGVTMTYSSPELLPALLEKVSATLQELYLEQSGIRDSHLEAILPALSQCFQLTSFSMCGNLLSMPIMEKMLRHTSELPSLG